MRLGRGDMTPTVRKINAIQSGIVITLHLVGNTALGQQSVQRLGLRLAFQNGNFLKAV